MTYTICGKCLHGKSSHIQHSENIMYCAKCNSICDKDEYDIQHKPSGSIVQDGQVFQLK